MSRIVQRVSLKIERAYRELVDTIAGLRACRTGVLRVARTRKPVNMSNSPPPLSSPTERQSCRTGRLMAYIPHRQMSPTRREISHFDPGPPGPA